MEFLNSFHSATTFVLSPMVLECIYKFVSKTLLIDKQINRWTDGWTKEPQNQKPTQPSWTKLNWSWVEQQTGGCYPSVPIVEKHDKVFLLELLNVTELNWCCVVKAGVVFAFTYLVSQTVLYCTVVLYSTLLYCTLLYCSTVIYCTLLYYSSVL